MTDGRWRARLVANNSGLAGIPVSMRAAADAPQPGVGTGHWARRARTITGALERTRQAIDTAPPGALRDELERVYALLTRRAIRYTRIAEIGQALHPDDDTTNADGTYPGHPPPLRGAAIEIDTRLVEATSQIGVLARAAGQLAEGLSDEAAFRSDLAWIEG